MPVSVTSQLKVVKLPVFDAAVNVSVAWIDCAAFRTVFCRFHVKVSDEVALAGFQLLAVMVSVSATLPVFLMYTVCVAVPPGLRAPMFRAVAVCVHWLSEYTFRFTAFIVPFRECFGCCLRLRLLLQLEQVRLLIVDCGCFCCFFEFPVVFPRVMWSVLSVDKC